MREETIKAREKGYAEGHSEGYDDAIKKSAIAFYENGVSIDLICKSLNITTQEFNDYLKDSK